MIDVLLSVGGGNARANKSDSKFGGGSLEKALTEISYHVHEKVRSESKEFFNYHRLDVDEGLEDVRLNEWIPKCSGKTTLHSIREATARYLQRQEVKSQLEKCAANSVKYGSRGRRQCIGNASQQARCTNARKRLVPTQRRDLQTVMICWIICGGSISTRLRMLLIITR